jgi:hypothetical protein
MARGYVRGDVTRLRVLLGNGQVLLLTGAGRRPLTLIPVRLGEWRYAVLTVGDSARSLRWTAYDRSGSRLGTGRLAGFSANWPGAFPFG